MTPDVPLRDASVFRFRANAFQSRRTYRLTDDALTWEEEGKPLDGVFFDGIAEVHMTFAPTRATRNRYRTRIVFRQGGMVELSNMEYEGFASFADRSADYVAFLRELHQRLAAHPGIVFRKGSSPAAFAGNILLTVFIFAMIAFAFTLLTAVGIVWMAVVKLAIILFFVPTLIRFIKRSRPASYDPRALSSDVLPAV